jgi:CDP-2,3-bis-(O-geranylgeranyl)-sn-glycerol synthase
MRYAFDCVWFFLPAFVANQCPGFAKTLRLPGTVPVHERWLGVNKTWSAYYAAVLGACMTAYVQYVFGSSVLAEYGIVHIATHAEALMFGSLCGFGAVLGDHAKSFVKRRIGRAPGTPWWPWDQVDFALGALLCALPYVGGIEWGRVAVILVVAIVGHPFVNYVGYVCGLRTRVL